MVSPTDPNEVRFTGENSFIRLFEKKNGPMTTRISHWRSFFSPAGQGHALFLKSELTDDQVLVYSDNIALVRYLQEEIESMLFPEFSDQSLPVIDAIFTRSGDSRSYWTETVESDEDTVLLTWYDFAEPFVVRTAAAPPTRPLEVYSCFIPARRAQATFNDEVAKGQPLPDQRGDRVGSTASLALSETWVSIK